ncbi:hypothetical protein E2C01_012095 [Portunus trituberculatus]|uniref:Uncharacterized protein n=1 Tax=Portunus trituberculatus TaxID=210409 RepID=A0A5B7DDP6_PORTR|nr:hypothetical protein [Portunus trituberculatus]
MDVLVLGSDATRPNQNHQLQSLEDYNEYACPFLLVAWRKQRRGKLSCPGACLRQMVVPITDLFVHVF